MGGFRSWHQVAEYFGVAAIGDITWAHAVNNRRYLEKVLASSEKMFLEGDVSLGENSQIIMAHPPARESDLTLDEWLETVIASRRGIKLDFKVPEIVEPVLQRLQSEQAAEKAPLMLNADILPGPGGKPSAFQPEKFVTLACHYCPAAILSLGWTTTPDAAEGYTRAMTQTMENMLGDNCQLVTFPVRAIYYFPSQSVLDNLLEKENYSLTFWNNETLSKDLKFKIRQAVGNQKAFYDFIPWQPKN